MVRTPGTGWLWGALVAAAVAAWPRIADAKTYKVRIDSRPRGATVSLGSGKVLGKTPLSARLSAGSHVIIIKRAGYVEAAESIDVSRSKRRFRYRLERAETGKVRVVGKSSGLKGATILIDGKEVGSLPDTVTVEVGYREVQVKKDGFAPFDDWVTVEADETVTVRAAAEPAKGASEASFDDDEEGVEDLDDDDGGSGDTADNDNDNDNDKNDDDGKVAALDGDDDDDDGGGADAGGKVSAAATAKPKRPRGSLASLRLGLDLGGRVFRYQNPQTANLRPYQAFGVPIGRLAAEVYPLGFTSSKLAGAFGLTASLGLAAPLTSEATVADMSVPVKTSWSDYAVGARLRYPATSSLAVALGATIGKTRFNFNDEGSPVEGQVPDVSYSETAVALDVESAVGDGNKLVLGGRFLLLSDFGELGQRFEVSSSLGVGAVARFDLKLTSLLDLVIRGSYQLVKMDLAMKDAAFVADGGTDQYLGLMVGIGASL